MDKWRVLWNKPTPTCPRAEMHFHNSDKLDLTANHRQQWLRMLRADVRSTLQGGSTKTSMRVCVQVCALLAKWSHLG